MISKILFIVSALALAQAVSINHRMPVAAQQVMKATELHTIAIPKPYVAPSVFAKPIVAAPSSSSFVNQRLIADEEYDENPSYSFNYAVNDPTTGDVKSQEETLEDGVVQGVYSLEESDGTIRRVTYTADDDNGFQATVEKLEGERRPVPIVPVVKSVPTYQATPIYHKQLISSVLHGAH